MFDDSAQAFKLRLFSDGRFVLLRDLEAAGIGVRTQPLSSSTLDVEILDAAAAGEALARVITAWREADVGRRIVFALADGTSAEAGALPVERLRQLCAGVGTASAVEIDSI